MESWEKDDIKIRLATCFRILLQKKKSIGEKNKEEDIEDIHLVNSMRQLEADSGVSFTLIQKLFVGERDVQFTSIINLLKSLKVPFIEFAELYNEITDVQIADEQAAIADAKLKRERRLKSKKSK